MSEQVCKKCNGQGRMGQEVCRVCNGRGVLLYDGDSLYKMPSERKPFVVPKIGKSVPEMLDEIEQSGEFQPYSMPVIDKDEAKRRDYALKTAMAAFQMAHGVPVMGPSKDSMEWSDIIPLARAVEYYLKGD